MKTYVLYSLLLAWAIAGYSQVNTQKFDPSQIKALGNEQHILKKMPKVDMKSIIEEDKNDIENGLPPRFGKAISTDINLSDGIWKDVMNGKSWSIDIESEDARSINMIFRNFYLKPGAELYIYNNTKTRFIGPITHEQNNKSGVYATDILPGHRVTVHLFEPNTPGKPSSLKIDKVIHGYSTEYIGYGDSAPCHTDIICRVGVGWGDEADAVAMVLLDDGTRFCSGVLLNNGCSDFTPSFLTAFHCLDTDSPFGALSQSEQNEVDSWVFRFGYATSACGGGGPDDYSYHTISGATFRSAWRDSDFALLELDHRPSGTSGVRYAGWDRTTTAPTSSVGIHHPRGDVMKISTEDDPATVVSWPGFADTTHWRVHFDDGVVEHGSSGSALFNQNGRVVGQLHGDQNNICPPADNSSCFCNQDVGEYGRLSSSWIGGGTATTRLSTWLTNDTSVSQTNTIQIPNISGPGILCNSNTNFTISNVPAGQSVSWVVTPSNLVYNSSGSGSTATLKSKTSTSSGQATLTFTFDNGIDCPNQATFSKTFWVGPPSYNSINLSVDGDELSNCDYTYADASYNYPSGAGWYILEYEWRIPYSYDWDIYEEYGGLSDFQYVEIEYWDDNPPSQEAIQIRARNTCGWSLWKEFWVDVDDCGGYFMMMSPNPSADYVEISFQNKETVLSSKNNTVKTEIVEEKDVLTKIYDQQHNEIYSNQSKVKDKLTIDTSTIQPGHYIIKVFVDENIFTRHLLVE